MIKNSAFLLSLSIGFLCSAQASAEVIVEEGLNLYSHTAMMTMSLQLHALRILRLGMACG
ncbi:hypothetical protein YEEN111655_09095 [Yersinia entomophaga]